MQESNSRHQDIADTTVAPLRGLIIMAGSVLAIVAAVATPVLGEALLAVLLYGKPVKEVFRKKSGVIKI